MEKKKGETEAQYVAVLLFHDSSIHFLNFTYNSGLEHILAVVGWGGGVQPGHQSTDDAHGKEEELFSYSTKCELALLKRPVKIHDITHKLGCNFCVSLVD